MSRPVVHVTNHSTRRLHHGRVWNAMARPRPWERGHGTLHPLCPDATDLALVRAGQLTGPEYRDRFQRKLGDYLRHNGAKLSPGPACPLQDGDTVCCACSAARAAVGACHRCWIAEALLGLGWAVVLDGVTLPPTWRAPEPPERL